MPRPHPLWLLPLLLLLGAVVTLLLLQSRDRLPPAGGPVSPAAATALLQELDRGFASRDAKRCVDAFVWDDRGQRQLLLARLQQLFQGPPLQQRSTLQSAVRDLGPRSVALVRREYRRQAQSPEADAADAVWLLLTEVDGKAVPTGLLDAGDGSWTEPSMPFRCPACNYQVGGVAGWLCAPARPDRAEAIEAVTFLLAGTDVSCEVSVEIGDRALAAPAVASELADSMRRLLPAARAGALEPWLPPSMAAGMPPQVSGARLRLDLPDGTGNLLHVVCLGALRHKLIVRGQPASLAARASQIQELLASYLLLQTDADLAMLAARPILHHQGGELRDGGYHNDRYHLRCTGPAGWQPGLRAGGAAFSVVWTCPKGTGRMHLTGYPPPPGLPCWLAADADCWLEDLCQRAGLAPDPAHDSGWCDEDRPLLVRQLLLRPQRPGADVPARRLLRLAIRSDLLVVLDGYVTQAADEDALRAAFATLKAP